MLPNSPLPRALQYSWPYHEWRREANNAAGDKSDWPPSRTDHFDPAECAGWSGKENVGRTPRGSGLRNLSAAYFDFSGPEVVARVEDRVSNYIGVAALGSASYAS